MRTPPFKRSPTRPAFTLLEMLMTLAILAVVTALMLPAFNDNVRLRLMAGAELMASDIETAQVMTIAQPSAPVVVRFDAPRNRYWLASADDTETPLARAGGHAPYLVTLGEGRARAARAVRFELADLDDGVLRFDAQGGLTDFGRAPSITVTVDDASADAHPWIEISIAPSTGSITQTAGEG